MMIADSDVLIDFLRGRSPWRERIKLEIKTGHLATTAINSFELLSGAKDRAERDKVSRLLGALTGLGGGVVSADAASAAASATTSPSSRAAFFATKSSVSGLATVRNAVAALTSNARNIQTKASVKNLLES